MTKEELKQEAEEYAEGMAKYYASTHEDCIPSQFEKYLRNVYISSAEPREKRIEELEDELKKWKDEWQEQVQKATDEGYARTLQTIQLSKAKEILAKLLEEEKNNMYWEMNGSDKSSYYEVRKQAEQFLKDSEVNNALC